MYIPADAIDEKLVAFGVGYRGSSNDHCYCSVGATAESVSLSKRGHACGCQPCLRLQPGCTMTPENIDLKVGTTAKATTVKLY